MDTKKPTILVILDGFGIVKDTPYNAIKQAKTPHFNAWLLAYPQSVLTASGPAVGLPLGIIGNSEVGHLTIGAGRRIKQPLALINEAIANGSFFSNSELITQLNLLHESGKTLHIMGLLSDAGVHSHTQHLFAFIKAAHDHKIKRIIIHPFLDGRDVPPKSAALYLEQLSVFIKDMPSAHIGTIHGRFYAMDRDHNWDRTKQSYNTLTTQQETMLNTWQAALAHYYAKNITDEFIPPTHLIAHACVKPEDALIFFNFRPDRARQLSSCFVQQSCPECTPTQLPLSFFMTPVSYGKQLKNSVLFRQKPIDNTLKEILANNGKTIFAIAETEKYAHITYFFGGRHESVLPNETRTLIPSIKTISYAEYPHMSAGEITQTVIKSLQNNPADFYLINYANADMVGHSGNLSATIKAIEYLDDQLGKLYEQVIEKMNGTLYITSDHGKAEEMVDDKGNPRTAHTANQVPFIMIQKELENKTETLPLNELADIAPFILQQMGLKIPEEMNK